MVNSIIHGDCLEVMKGIDEKSIDMILCDLPYGTTACKWDTIIPFEPLWKQYERVIKDRGAIVLFGSQPFTSKLIMSNLKLFKYEWVWEKTNNSNFMMIKKQPRKLHENIVIFSKLVCKYFPQMQKGKPYIDKPRKRSNRIINSTMPKLGIENKGTRYPSSIQLFSNGNNNIIHPTQKPVALFEYLIKTYTNEGELVLDNCSGSGTTAIACMNTGRNYICIEKEEKYIELSRQRVKEHEEKYPLLEKIT